MKQQSYPNTKECETHIRNHKRVFKKSQTGFQKRRKERPRMDLKIVLLNVGPNNLKGLCTRNLRNPNKVLHLRRDSPRFHNASELSFPSGGLLGSGGESGRAYHAQVQGYGPRTRRCRGKTQGERRRFTGEKGGDKPTRHSHVLLPFALLCPKGIMCLTLKKRVGFVFVRSPWG